jgi:hypothetical protein
MTLPAEEPGTRPESPGNRRPREMATLDRIRLTGLLKENPAFAGFSYLMAGRRCITGASRELQLRLWIRDVP